MQCWTSHFVKITYYPRCHFVQGRSTFCFVVVVLCCGDISQKQTKRRAVYITSLDYQLSICNFHKQLAICNLQFEICNLQFAICNFHNISTFQQTSTNFDRNTQPASQLYNRPFCNLFTGRSLGRHICKLFNRP
jgi:hypothetical protein